MSVDLATALLKAQWFIKYFDQINHKLTVVFFQQLGIKCDVDLIWPNSTAVSNLQADNLRRH